MLRIGASKFGRLREILPPMVEAYVADVRDVEASPSPTPLMLRFGVWRSPPPPLPCAEVWDVEVCGAKVPPCLGFGLGRFWVLRVEEGPLRALC